MIEGERANFILYEANFVPITIGRSGQSGEKFNEVQDKISRL